MFDYEEHKVLKNISKPYEKARARELYELLTQVKELPTDRKMIFQQKKMGISGCNDTLFVVEVSRNKL